MKILQKLIYENISTRSTTNVSALVREALLRVKARQDEEVNIQVHPLGFIALRWELNDEDALRVHIWSRDMKTVQSPNWPIHDHTFSFRSLVLQGCVQNKVYRLKNCNKKSRLVKVYEVEYSGGSSILLGTQKFGEALQSSSELQPLGSYYDMDAGVFHRSILRSDFAITVLATHKVSKAVRAQVLGNPSFRSPLLFNRTAASENLVYSYVDKALFHLDENNTA